MKKEIETKSTEFKSIKEALKSSSEEFQKTNYSKYIKFSVGEDLKRIIEKGIIDEDIKNLEWANAVIKLLIRRQDIFVDTLFNKLSDEYSDVKNTRLIYSLLNYYKLGHIKTLDSLANYKNRAKHLSELRKLKKIYTKFQEDLEKNITLLFPDENDNLIYLIGLRTALNKYDLYSQLINDLENDFINECTPRKSKNFSQKQKNKNEFLAVPVIKIINAYLEACFRIDSKMTIKNHYALLTEIANDFCKELNNKRGLYDRYTIKGIISKTKDSSVGFFDLNIKKITPDCGWTLI